MVAKILRFLNRDIVSMNQAAILLAAFSLISQLCGLLRDRLLASTVGPSMALDTYYAAFRVPDFVYNSFGVLFSVTVLIPFIAKYLTQEKQVHSITAEENATSTSSTSAGSYGSNKKMLQQFLDSIFTVYVGGMIILLVCLYIAMPWITHLTVPGFTGIARTQTILFSRIMLLSPFLFGLSSLLSSFAQVQKKFFSFAVAPLFYNIGILLGILVLRPLWGMLGVVIGVVGGALLYFLIQVPTLISLGTIPRLNRIINWKIVGDVVRSSLPRTLGSSLTNITFIMMSAIASLLAVGSISVFQFSYNIENTPLLIIGVSYAVAAFPAMAKAFAENNHAGFIDVLYRTTRTIFFLTIPASLFIIVLRAHVVRILLGSGVFSWNDTRLVAATVALFSVSVVAQAMVLLLVRAFFAIGDTKTPLRINMFSLFVTVIATIVLLVSYKYSLFFHDIVADMLRIDGVAGTSVVMLAGAFSIGQISNACLLWYRFHGAFRVRIQKQVLPQAGSHQSDSISADISTTTSTMNTAHSAGFDGGSIIDSTTSSAPTVPTIATLFHHKTLYRPLGQMIAAGIVASYAVYGTLLCLGPNVDQRTFVGIAFQAIIAGLVGAVVYISLLLMAKNEDAIVFLTTIKSKFWKQSPEVVGQQDL